MSDRIFKLDDAAKQRAVEITDQISSCILQSYEQIQLVWASLGITESQAQERTEAIFAHFKATADTIRKTEVRQENEAIEHNQNVGREIDELYIELGIDGSVNYAEINDNDTIFELKAKLEREFDRLIALKDKRLEGIRSLKQREVELCSELDAEQLPIKAERVPSPEDIREMETQVKLLENEKKSRQRSVAEARSKVLDLWSQLGESASSAFEADLLNDTLRLTRENVQKARDLVESLTVKVKERYESLELRKNEIELLWSRLDYSTFHASMFKEKYFGIKAEQFNAMDAELIKLRAEKEEKLGQFIENVRHEVRSLGEKLMYGPGAFSALEEYLSSSEATQSVLDKLESIANKMRMDLESRGTLLRKVQKWEAMISDYHRVEAESKDPNRLKNRGGGLLALSKESAKLAKTIPEFFGKLRQEILDWEIANEVEFKINDARYVDRMESMFFNTSLGPKPRVPLGAAPSTGKRKQPPPSNFSNSKMMKRNDGTMIAPGRIITAPLDSTLESVPDFNAFRLGIDSASKSHQVRRRSPRLHDRLKNSGLKALANPLRPGPILRGPPTPSRAPFNELTGSPMVNHQLTSTQVESPSKRNQFPRFDLGSGRKP